jgi:hypothetical protein
LDGSVAMEKIQYYKINKVCNINKVVVEIVEVDDEEL